MAKKQLNKKDQNKVLGMIGKMKMKRELEIEWEDDF